MRVCIPNKKVRLSGDCQARPHVGPGHICTYGCVRMRTNAVRELPPANHSLLREVNNLFFHSSQALIGCRHAPLPRRPHPYATVCAYVTRASVHGHRVAEAPSRLLPKPVSPAFRGSRVPPR